MIIGDPTSIGVVLLRSAILREAHPLFEACTRDLGTVNHERGESLPTPLARRARRSKAL